MFGDSAEIPDVQKDWVEEEVLRSILGSWAVSVIDRVPTVKELIEGIIGEAEAIRRRWSLG